MEQTNSKSWSSSKVFWGSVIIILLITSAAFYSFKEKEKGLRIYTEKKLVETINKKETVENELIETIKAKEDVEEELVTEKERSLALEKEVEEREHQVKLVLEKLEKEEIARRQAEAHLIIAMEGKRVLEEKLRGPARRSKTVKLGAIIVKPAPLLTGKVLAVNEAYDFIIVDLGRANDMTIGDILSVYRNDGLIGRVQVEKVEEKNSAAAILPEWQGVEFKENDEVRGI